MRGCRWALQQLQVRFCVGDAGGFQGLTSTEVDVRAEAAHAYAALCDLSASSPLARNEVVFPDAVGTAT